MRLTFLHVVVLLATAAHVVESAIFRKPYIVLVDPYTEFDPGPATVEVKPRMGGIKLRCSKNRQETNPDTNIQSYWWQRTNSGQVDTFYTPSNELTIKHLVQGSFYAYQCRIDAVVVTERSAYSDTATISFVRGPPLGSHPEVSNHTSISVDVSWKKPTTTDTFTDYDIKISPIYSKETASVVKGDVENPLTHLTNLKPLTIYEVSVRTRTVFDGNDFYGPEMKQLFVTKDSAKQKERSLGSIIICFVVSICITS